ncbi:hypothetical protein ACHAXT_006167 [Thalassiosira profunda]
MSSPVRFSVTYERDTAVACVQSVFPSAPVEPKCVNKYPVRVIIHAHSSGGESEVIWEGDQRSLFRKYARRRDAAREEIIGRLNEYKASKL